MLNKARLFDERLAKNLVTTAKVSLILVDFNQKMEEILLDMRDLFEGLVVEGLVPLDQMPNIFINTKELPTLKDGRQPTGTMVETLTSTKPSSQPQTSELAKEALEEEKESASKPKSQPEPDPTLEEGKSPQPLVLNDMATASRRVLSKNPDIAQWMMEHLKSQLERPLQLEEFQATAKPIGD